jgi:DNA-binding CsgD family transcriptional regulator
MKAGASVSERRASLHVMDLYQNPSRNDLLAVLRAMYRILDADKRQDLERLVAELPMLVPFHIGARDLHTDTHKQERMSDPSAPGEASTFRLLHCVLSQLSKEHSASDVTGPDRLCFKKSQYHLTPRELTVLSWMKEGKTNWEIAKIIGLSERTVRFHVGSILDKLNATSRAHAVARALELGLLTS